MGTFKDLSGEQFGRWTVVNRAPENNRHNQVMWNCVCICGSKATTMANSLLSGRSRSCGCVLAEKRKEMNITHGLTVGGNNTCEYDMFTNAKCRAKKKGIPFSLELADIVVPEFCPVFPTIRLNRHAKVGFSFDSPSLDKLVPLLGYIKSNIRVISNRANTLKRDGTLEEIVRLAEWLKGELHG